jgi:hypothetical protein
MMRKRIKRIRKEAKDMGDKVLVDKAYVAKLYEDSYLLKLIRKVIEEDNNRYGYSDDTKAFVDTLLGIKRAEE